MQNNNVIEIRNLDKSFKVVYDKPQTLKERIVSVGRKNNVEKRLILNDITLDIKKGETVALIGTNGSGKSTLLKLMTKILYPTKGMLETHGKLTSLLELGAGFHPDFTGRENIFFNAAIFGLTKKEINKRMDDIISFSELESFIDNPVRTYSSGMYMRLAFSIAINVDADILLIDEILAVGDQHFQDKCFNKLVELKQSDKTIVIVSHDLNSIKNLCNRAIWIYKGEVKGDGNPVDVIDAYLDQVTKDHQDKRKTVVNEEVETIKKEFYRGLVHIDGPVENMTIPKTEEEIHIHGWELNDCFNSKLRIVVDDKEIENIKRTDRPDVLIIYDGLYGGAETNDKAGWETFVKTSDFESGLHKVRVEALSGEGHLIYKKETSFIIE